VTTIFGGYSVFSPSLINATNPKTQFQKGLISYLKTNGITSLKKHVMQIMVKLPRYSRRK